MNKRGVWGTDIEIYTLAHLLSTPVIVYVANSNDWVRYSPSALTSSVHDDLTDILTLHQVAELNINTVKYFLPPPPLFLIYLFFPSYFLINLSCSYPHPFLSSL